MNVLGLVELVVAALLFYLGVAQVVLPLWRDIPLFPMFRRERQLQHKLAEATENLVEAELEKQIVETEEKAQVVRRTARRSVRPVSGSGEDVN